MSAEFRCRKRDCIYANPPDSAANGYANGCAYFQITGRSRIAQHAPEERDPALCRLYIPKEKQLRSRRAGMAPFENAPAWDPMAKSLHSEGETVPKIAKVCGVCEGTIRKWLLRRNLEPNKPKPRPSRIDWEKARALYDAGYSDVKIAKMLMCSSHMIMSWRKKNGLPALYGNFGKAVKK